MAEHVMNANKAGNFGTGGKPAFYRAAREAAPAEIRRVDYEDPELQRYKITWDSDKLE